MTPHLVLLASTTDGADTQRDSSSPRHSCHDRPQTEVVGPTTQMLVELTDQFLVGVAATARSVSLADLPSQPLHLLLGRTTHLHRPGPSAASSNVRTCTPESRTSRPAARQTRVFVSFTVKLQLPHDAPHRAIASFGVAPAADHKSSA